MQKKRPAGRAFPPLTGSNAARASLRGDAVSAAAESARRLDLLDLRIGEAEHVAEDLLRVLAEQRRALDLARAVRELDRVADGDVFAARRMIHLDERARGEERAVLGDLFHGQDRAARDVVFVEDLHGLELGLGHGPFFDARENLVEARETGRRRRIIGVRLPFRLADHVADRLPDRRLGDEVDIGVGIALPSFALQDAAGLAAAGIVAGARHRVAERDALAELAVFLERAMAEALLVTQLD